MNVNGMIQGVNGFFGGLFSNISSIHIDKITVGMGKVYQNAKADFVARSHEHQIGIALSVIFTGVVLLVSTWLLIRKGDSKAQPTPSLSLSPNAPEPINVSALKPRSKPTSSTPKIALNANSTTASLSPVEHRREPSQYTVDWEKKLDELVEGISDGPLSSVVSTQTSVEEVDIQPVLVSSGSEIDARDESLNKAADTVAEKPIILEEMTKIPTVEVRTLGHERLRTRESGVMPAPSKRTVNPVENLSSSKPAKTTNGKDKIESQEKISAASSAEGGKSKKSGKGILGGLLKRSKK